MKGEAQSTVSGGKVKKNPPFGADLFLISVEVTFKERISPQPKKQYNNLLYMLKL
jgi:hypothetical protein